MISIVVPIYNSQSFLSKCLSSISSQTFKDFECILVDDGSTDGSEDICDIWAKKDERFKVIHKTNQGVSSARNTGIDLASGEWITFIDSDDWVERDYLIKLVEASEKSDYCIAGFKLFAGRDIQCFVPTRKIGEDFSALDAKTVAEYIDKNMIFSPWSKLYKKDLILNYNIRFPEELAYGEDLMFNFSYLKHCLTISSVSESLYIYNKQTNSLSTSDVSIDWNTNIEQWRIIASFMKERGFFQNEVKVSMYNRLMGMVYDVLFSKIEKAFWEKQVNAIFSCPEIREKGFKESLHNFNCALWIKLCISYKLKFLIRWARSR